MPQKRASRAGFLLAGTLAALLLWPGVAWAYVGPGAGFAVLSSFLTLFLAFLYSLIALLSWPLRQFRRLLRRRKVFRKARVRQVVILGLDGMDPDLAERYMQEGKLPHLAALRNGGTFLPLQTTCPPISPVAWSSFQTGVNPGKHNIYDFLGRDCATYLPYLSSVQIRAPRRSLALGKYAIPLGRPRCRMLRKAKPFWHYLAEADIFCSVIRVPITFPAEKFSGVLLASMCVPDLKGSQGTFSFYTTRDGATEGPQGGLRFRLQPEGGQFRSYIPGPENHLLKTHHSELRIPLLVRPDAARGEARIEIQGQRLTVRRGEYSKWVELKFKAGLGIKVHGICRFYVKALEPHLELYVTPVNIHPGRPALPISYPFTYSIYLAKLLGLYATLGLAEDTWALNEGVLDEEAFLRQCYLIHEERERIFFDSLKKTRRGLCVCVFDITDRVQHMFWRYLGNGHPAAGKDGGQERFGGVIEELYRHMDDLVGRTLQQLDEDSLLLVISDHGFKSFERGVNLNTWLWQNGFLALQDGAQPGVEWFGNVDWQRTRAYALGLNGIYINQKGRERDGIVAAGRETEQLKQQLCETLGGLVDPQTGRVGIRAMFDSRKVFTGPYRDNAPDLIVGYNEGYHAAWDSVTGTVSSEVFQDNRKAWSGDHSMDPRLVPGVLFSNQEIHCKRPSLLDIAPTVLDLFGVPVPPHFEGEPWVFQNPT